MSLINVVLLLVLTVITTRLFDLMRRRREFESRARLLERVDRVLRVCFIPHDPSLDLPEECMKLLLEKGAVPAMAYLHGTAGLPLYEARERIRQAIGADLELKLALVLHALESCASADNLRKAGSVSESCA
ncbi:MAG: hypothetical protein L6R00_12790 [Phycisphaerae bacterium]|nr:hypothetical protein [Phycisphaerae bacterium]